MALKLDYKERKGALIFAFALALLLHLALLSPVAHWLKQSLLPSFSERDIDLELLQIKRKEKEKDRWKRLPKHKKRLAQQEQKGQSGGAGSVKRGRTRKDEWAKKGPFSESPAMLEELKSTLKGKGPNPTAAEGLKFTMNTYRWSWERYIENWAVDLSRWWQPPNDYMSGQYPEGGFVWVRVRLSPGGEMLGYEILEHNVSSEMKMMVVQALLGARLRPPLPADFTEKELQINWKFIYPRFADLRHR